MLLSSQTEPTEALPDRWRDQLSDLEDDSDESSCSDEFEPADDLDYPAQNVAPDQHQSQLQSSDGQIERLIIRPSPRRPPPLLQIVEAMPKLERMKHCPSLESIDEEDVNCLVQETLQAMEAVPVALQTIQALSISAGNSKTSEADLKQTPLAVTSKLDFPDPHATSAAAVGAS